MGFLDKLFGRNKDAASAVTDKAEPRADTPQDAADKATDAAGAAAPDVADTGQETVSDATGSGDPPSAA